MEDNVNGGGADRGPDAPQAWTWSQFKGEAEGGGSPAPQQPAQGGGSGGGSGGAPGGVPADAASAGDAASQGRSSSLAALGLAAVIIVIGGLTWLFTTQSETSKPAPAAVEEELPAIRTAPAGGEGEPSAAPSAPAASAPAPAASQEQAATAPARKAGPKKRAKPKAR